MAATNKEKVDIDLLEEDDEFEEFPQDDWDAEVLATNFSADICTKSE